ncbi:MAG: FtsX-like permease family protein [Pirellulaceae bacterium]|nr:FtsX-like permease family protein [Pirellulaceae bacterium]
MATNLAFANIRSSGTRSVVSVSGIGVSVILIFMQLGFRGAVENTATMIFEKMDFDLLIRSKDYLHFVDSRQIPRNLATKTRQFPEVLSSEPFMVSMGNWRHPKGKRIRGIVIMGIPYGTTPFTDPEVKTNTLKLTSDRFVLIDRRTHHEFGPEESSKFGDPDIGVVTNVNNRSIEKVGHFEIGAGLTANGALITSEIGFSRLVRQDTRQKASMILVKLKSSASIDQTAEKIRKLISSEDHAEVFTRPEVLKAELTRWIDQTPLGFVFQLGVIVSFIVGSAIVFMVLSNDVSNRLPEYATLKAMGYTNNFLAGIVFSQATYLACLAFVPALLFSWALYQITSLLANVPIEMTSSRVLFVFGLSLIMCWFSGLGALKKLWQAEPASLF